MNTGVRTAIAAAAMLLVGCEQLPPTEPSPVVQAAVSGNSLAHVPVATRPELLVSVDWLARHQTRPNVKVLHVGTRANYDLGHVPGAFLVELSALQTTVDGVPFTLRPPEVLRSVLEDAGVSTSDHIVVTGDGPLQAARGFFVLEYLGHPRVALLDGGRAAWQSAFGLSTAPALAGRSGRLVTPVRQDRLATAGTVLNALGVSRVVLLDARPASDFNNARIPGALSLPWSQLVISSAMPLLRPTPQLRALYAATGATVRDDVITYCTSGMMSSMAYFVARYLGYDVQLYDGSMLEWTARGLPLES
jgi:thiosulfate/3-mercaptopyruvate sulfurtransferase